MTKRETDELAQMRAMLAQARELLDRAEKSNERSAELIVQIRDAMRDGHGIVNDLARYADEAKRLLSKGVYDQVHDAVAKIMLEEAEQAATELRESIERANKHAVAAIDKRFRKLARLMTVGEDPDDPPVELLLHQRNALNNPSLPAGLRRTGD